VVVSLLLLRPLLLQQHFHRHLCFLLLLHLHFLVPLHQAVVVLLAQECQPVLLSKSKSCIAAVRRVLLAGAEVVVQEVASRIKYTMNAME
jgi:hypothetical protein